MDGQDGLGFGGLLRRLRDEAGLTQEELAEAAGVSQRAVSDLERGINRTARKDTALLLAGALGLTGQPRDLFIAAARGRGQPLRFWRPGKDRSRYRSRRRRPGRCRAISLPSPAARLSSPTCWGRWPAPRQSGAGW